jgi:hypothetical protein
MERKIVKWSINDLVNNKPNIGFPEFQREPTVWNLTKKQKLIDSILRGFDISPIYLYEVGENTYDCIDGRQRLNAIFSFVGLNDDTDKYNNFKISIDNEIYADSNKFLLDLKEKTYTDLAECHGIDASLEQTAKEAFDTYEINLIVIDNKLENPLELNLLFERLQIASVLNAGEKLHAMTGEMRDFIFKALPDGIQNHQFLARISPPYRRYAREQIAAQIALNYFSLKGNKKDFARSRYIDLQIFFKDKAKLAEADKSLIQNIRNILDTISNSFREDLAVIENRAIAVSTFLFASQLIENGKENKLAKFKDFLKEFIATIKWQVKAHNKMESATEYQDILTGFQNYITQAAGESYAIKKRHDFIAKYFEHYETSGEIIGDRQFDERNSIKAKDVRSSDIYSKIKLPES